MMRERGPQEGDESPADEPSLTRRALCAKAEELAVELVRWKVWRVEGHMHENLPEAQAMQALAMVLIELLDDVQGSRSAAQTELTRAVSLLGYTLQVVGSGTEAEAQRARAEEHRADVAFLRAHGLRLSDDEGTHEPPRQAC